MERKLFGILSGWQITALGIAAVLAPSAVFGVAAFTNVAVQDPVSGYRTSIDSSGHLNVREQNTDPLARYMHDPSYSFTALFYGPSSTCPFYTVPSNYYAVITSISGTLSLSGSSGGGFYITKGCGGGDITGAFGTPNPYQPLSINLGSGVAVGAGTQLGLDSRSLGNTGLFLHGYLVPYSAYNGFARANVPQSPLAKAPPGGAIPKGATP